MSFKKKSGAFLLPVLLVILAIIFSHRCYAQENELYIITGAHQDIGFGYNYQESMDEYAEQLKEHIKLIEVNPEIKFSMGNTYNTKDFVLRNPKYKERLKHLIAKGNITTPPQWVGGEFGWYTGEFLVRTVAYSKYWVMSQLDYEPHWFQFNDTPSLTPQLAQILRKSGVHFLQASKPSTLNYILKEGYPWYYVGLDGSKVILYTVDYGDAINFSDGFVGESGKWGNTREMTHWANNWKKRFSDFKVKLSLAITDRGTEPERSQRLKNFCREWNDKFAQQYGFKVSIKTEEDFARYLKQEIIDKEVPLKKVTGTVDPWPWASVAWAPKMMYLHSKVENRLPTVEKLSSINELLGLSVYPAQRINQAWEEILWYADHNWGSSNDVDKFRMQSIQKGYDITNQLMQAQLKQLADAVDYKKKGIPLFVFNPLNWKRTEVVNVRLDTKPGGKWRLMDSQGKNVPAQILDTNGQTQLVLIAKDIPSLGYKSFYLVDNISEPSKRDTDLLTGKDFIENSYYKVVVAADGSISSIYDKKNQKELVDNSSEFKYGTLNAFFVRNQGFKISHEFIPTNYQVLEKGPARASLQVSGHVGTQKTPVKMTVSLGAYLPEVEHIIQLDTREKGPQFFFYYVAPFDNLPESSQLGVPYGSVPNTKSVDRMTDINFSRRTPEKGFVIGDHRHKDISPWQKDIQKWVNLGDETYSVDLTFDNIQTRTFFHGPSFIASHLVGTWYQAFAGGIYDWRFIIRGHKGDWRDNDTPRFGWEASNLLLVVVAERGKGKLPEELSFFTLTTPVNPEGNNIVLSTFKKAFDDKGYVIRFYETEDTDGEVDFKFNPFLNIPQKEVSLANLIEQPLEVLTIKNSQYRLPILGYGIETVRFLPEVRTDITSPVAVVDLRMDKVTSASVHLNWTASGDDGKSGTAAGYELRYGLVPIQDSNWKMAKKVKVDLVPQIAGSQEQFIVTGLNPDNKYYFALKVFDEKGNSSTISNVVEATTEAPDTIPPVAVRDLSSAGSKTTSITLRWTASGDDGEKGQASYYKIGYSTQPIDENNWSNVSVLSDSPSPKPVGGKETVTVTGLVPETRYYFALKSMDESGNISSLSNVFSEATAALNKLRLQNGVSPTSSYRGCSDTHISNVNEEEAIMNYGETEFTRNWALGVRSVLIKFDLGPIPAAKIFKAVLKLFSYDITYGDAGTLTAYRLTQQWNDKECTWSRAGKRSAWQKKGGTIDLTSDYGRGPNGLVAKADVVDGGAWIEMDITALVKDWQAGKYPNYGLMIKGNCPEDCGIYYRSAEYSADKSLRPFLEVSY